MKGKHWGKHCLHIVKSVSTIKNWLQFVPNTTNDGIAANFLLLKHFWPWLNNVLRQNEGLHNDGDQKKRKKVPMIVKMSRRTPAPPRGGTSLSWPLTTTAPQKNEKKTFTTTSFTGILTQSTVCSTYPNYRPFYIFDTPCIEKNHTIYIANSTKSSLMPSTAA